MKTDSQNLKKILKSTDIMRQAYPFDTMVKIGYFQLLVNQSYVRPQC